MAKQLTEVEDLYHEAARHVMGPLRNYWLNHAFVRGLQWLRWNTAVTRLSEQVEDRDRIQAVFNKIRANQRTIIANLTQRELKFEITPTGPDDQSIRAARLGEAVLRDLHRNQRWEVLREEHMQGVCKGGTGALLVEIDPESKLPIVKPLSLAEFIVEPGSRNAETARWVIKVEALPPKTVKALFDMRKEPPSDAHSGLAPFQHRMLHHGFGTNSTVPELTKVLTYYERPMGNKKGGFQVIVDNKVIQKGKWPFPFEDRLPIAVARETVEENQWWGTTYMDDVRKVQVILNGIWSGIAEHAKELGTIRALFPASAEPYVEEMTDKPGFQPWPDGVPLPEYLEQPQLKNWYESVLDRAALMIDDIMGVHDVSRGLAPPNIESGSGLSILAENDTSPTGRLVKETARCWREVSEMCLKIYQKTQTKERTVTVDSGFGPERFPHKGSDLSAEFEVRVPSEGLLPRSKIGMIQQADKMLQMGLIDSPAQYIRIAELPGAEDLIAGISPQTHKARRENADLARGQISNPAWHKEDDHQIHISEHKAFMSTQRWELLPERVQNLFVKHVQMHKNFEAEARAKEIQMAGAEAMAEQVSGPMDPSMMGQPPGQQRQGPSPEPPTAPAGGGPEFNINDPVPKGGQPSIEDQISAITGTT